MRTAGGSPWSIGLTWNVGSSVVGLQTLLAGCCVSLLCHFTVVLQWEKERSVCRDTRLEVLNRTTHTLLHECMGIISALSSWFSLDHLPFWPQNLLPPGSCFCAMPAELIAGVRGLCLG